MSNGVSVTLSDLAILNGLGTGPNAGGGILNAGSLVVSNCLLAGNQAQDGGGILNLGSLRIESSTLASNLASLGGALQNRGQALLLNSTLNDNQAEAGGAIFNAAGSNTLVQCTLSGNAATNGNGGAVFNQANASLHLTACTVAFNAAAGAAPDSGRGGGVFNACQGRVYSRSSLYTGNTAATGAGHDFQGVWSTLGYNLVSAGEFTLAGCGDTPNTDPTDRLGAPAMLEPLADNGGSTLTHALMHAQGANAALDGGAPTGLPATDQRGFARSSDGNGDAVPTPDIGAFEYQNIPPILTAR